MASKDSSFDLQSLLADAQDLVDESFVARALLQPETNPWESFPLSLLYPAEEPFNEIHYSLLCDLPADSLPATQLTIKTEPAEDTPLFQPEPELTEYLHLTPGDSDLGYADTSTSPAITISSSSPPAEASQLLEPARDFYSTEQLDYSDTSSTTTPILPSLFFSTSASPATASFDSPTEFVASASPITTVSPLSSLSLSGPSYTDTESIHIISEDLQHSTVTLDVPYSTTIPAHNGGEPDEPVHYTFVNPHEKPRKRRTKGLKNSTRIACTFCRRRKIRCGGPQDDGVCKSCIRLNHKGECVFPAVSYRGQRLGGSNSSSKRKTAAKSKSSGQCALPPSELS